MSSGRYSERSRAASSSDSAGVAPGPIIAAADGSVALLMSGGRLSTALAHWVDMDFAERILGASEKRRDDADPLHVTGRLSKPDISPEEGAVAASLLTPIEVGAAEDAACQALSREARDSMADQMSGSAHDQRPLATVVIGGSGSAQRGARVFPVSTDG